MNVFKSKGSIFMLLFGLGGTGCVGGDSLSSNAATNTPAQSAQSVPVQSSSANLNTLNVFAQLAGNAGGATGKLSKNATCQTSTQAAQSAGLTLAAAPASQALVATSAWAPLSNAISALAACQATATDSNSVTASPNSTVVTPTEGNPEITPTPTPTMTPAPESENPEGNDCLMSCLSNPQTQATESANNPQAVQAHLAPGAAAAGIQPDTIAVCFAYCNINETAEFGGAVYTGQQLTGNCSGEYQAVLSSDVQVEGTPAFTDVQNTPAWSAFVAALKTAQSCQ